MKKVIVLFIAMLSGVAILFTGCSAIFHTAEAGNLVSKTYDFKDFTGVEISNAIQYEVQQSDSYSVVVSTHENTIEHLDFHQSGNTLHIGLKSNFGFFQDSATMVTVALPQLSILDISGSSRGNATGFDSAGSLEINVSGASDLNMNLKTGKTGIDESGSSEVAGTLQALDSQFNLGGASDCGLTGSAGNSSIEASGSSKMNSPGLALQSADVKLAGTSYAGIHTEGALNIDISGSSTLDYTGNPIIGKMNVNGGSKLNRK